MKRNLLFVLAIISMVVASLTASAAVTTYRHEDTVSNIRSDVIGGALVTVYTAGTTTLSSLYSSTSTASNAKANPTYTDVYGRFFFYAVPGIYDIKVSGSGITTYTVEDVILQPYDVPTGVFNVVVYGAAGDSTTNDTAAIQAAVDAAEAAGRGEVYFPSGIYSIATNFSTNGDNITFRGSAGSIILATTSATPFVIAHGASNIVVDGLSFTSTADTLFTAGRASIDINPAASTPHPTGITITNCTFYDTYTCGVSGELLNDVIVDGCVFKNMGEHGVYFATYSTNIVVSNCIFDGDDTAIRGGSGVKLSGTGAQFATISGNVISGFSSNGVLVEDCIGNATISNNILRGNKVGVRFGASAANDTVRNIAITGNIFSRSTLTDVTLAAGWGDISVDVDTNEVATEIVVSGNSFFGASLDTFSRVLRKHNGVGTGTISNMLVTSNVIGGSYVQFANYDEFTSYGNVGMENAPAGYQQAGAFKTPHILLFPFSGTPAGNEGTIYYDSDDSHLKLFTGTDWEQLSTAASSFAAGILDSLTLTTCTAADTFYVVAGNFSIDPSRDFTFDTDHMNYNGESTKYFQVSWAATVLPDNNLDIIHVGIRKNISNDNVTGTQGMRCTTADYEYNIAGESVFLLSTGDDLHFVLSSNGAGDVVGVNHFSAVIRAIE